MPELPEVETLCRQLDRVISGARVRSVVRWDRKLPDIRGLRGLRIDAVQRRGKRIEIDFEGDVALFIHLRMTGRFEWHRDDEPVRYARWMLELDGGRLYLSDPRRFATLAFGKRSGGPGNAHDPLQGLTAAKLSRAAGARRLPIKAFLTDQNVIGGIGNIYACEILYRAAISPWRRACDLDSRKWGNVEKAMASILQKAIDCGGTSFSDWADLFGKRGCYQRFLKVYGREGKPCQRCGAPIVRVLMAGRATFFCPSCQAT